MKDILHLQLQNLPYFRALIRSVEAAYYQEFDLPSPTLDLGCGDGHFTSLTFDRIIEAGVDPWFGPIREARSRECYELLVQADGGHNPFPDDYFGSAFSNSVLEHILDVDTVLVETARVLKPGAPFYFCVPNERYLTELSITRLLGSQYTKWFKRISRVEHADDAAVWGKRLENAGFEIVRCWHYFSPAAMRVLEWGHYFGLPSLLARTITGKWIIAPGVWNLRITERYVRRYSSSQPVEDGTFTFYIARKRK